jgi:hypothetical protein
MSHYHRTFSAAIKLGFVTAEEFDALVKLEDITHQLVIVCYGIGLGANAELAKTGRKKEARFGEWGRRRSGSRQSEALSTFLVLSRCGISAFLAKKCVAHERLV